MLVTLERVVLREPALIPKEHEKNPAPQSDLRRARYGMMLDDKTGLICVRHAMDAQNPVAYIHMATVLVAIPFIEPPPAT